MDSESRNETDSNLEKKEESAMLESDAGSAEKDENISLDSAERLRNLSTRQKIRVYCAEIPLFQVWLLVVIHIILGLQFFLFPILYDELIRDMNASTADVGWVASIQHLFLQGAGIFFTGPLRRFGNKKVTVFGGAIVFLAMALTSLAPNLYVMYVTYGMLAGIGLAALFLVLNVVTQQLFSKHRTMLTLFVFSGFSMGQFLCPSVTYALLDHYSWRGTMLIYSAILANVIPIGMLFPDEEATEDAMDESMEPREGNRFLAYLKEIFDFSFLKDVPFLLYHITTMFVRIPAMASFFHIPNFLISRDVPKNMRTLLLTLQNAVSFTVRIVLGVVSESRYVDRKVLHGIGAVLSPVAAFILPMSSGPAGYGVALAAFGIHLVCWGALVPVFLVDLLGVENIGRSSAINLFADGLNALVAPPFAGWIYDVTQDYNIPFYVNAGMGSIAIGLYVATYVTLRKRKKKEAALEQSKPPQTSQLEQLDPHGSDEAHDGKKQNTEAETTLS